MNRLCYRVIFSRVLGRLVVVSEKTLPPTKNGSRSGVIGINQHHDRAAALLQTTLNSLSVAILLGFGCIGSAAYANITLDTQAANAQKPIVGMVNNANNQPIPVIHIQTPQHGVSHNKYTQFDVHTSGVILNNSRQGANTQLAGQLCPPTPFYKKARHTPSSMRFVVASQAS
ncbi:MAG: ESPR-type extended signal peptide-containing protein [Moraxella sp.]|nr:ESPR-type extended signal peptide-containing protein [Moraxella sp.]